MHDKDGGERMSGRRGQGELVVGGIGKEAICNCQSAHRLCWGSLAMLRGGCASLAVRTGVVADHGPVAAAILAVPKDAKVHAAEGSERDGLDDGRRERGEEQQYEGDEE